MNKTRILVVEDQAIVAQDIIESLDRLGYESIGAAARAEEAVELAEKLQPDLILMDIHLNGPRDGISAAQEAHERLAIPVVFLTAYADDATLERAKTAAPYGFIVKPFQDRELRSTLEMALFKVRAEQALREREQVLCDILESTLSGYWDWNIAADTEYLSPTFKKMFGYEDHEVANSPESWQKMIFPEDLPGVLETFDRHIKSHGRVPYYNEVRYRHKDGSTVWVICAGRVIEWAADGSALRMVGCHVNITARKQAEAALARERSMLRTLIDNLPDFIYIKDAEHRHLLSNVANAALLGLSSPEQTIGKTDFDLFPSELAEVYMATEKRVMQTGKPVIDFEEPLLDTTGHQRWQSTTQVPLHDQDGKVIGLVGIGRDITARKRMETQLRQSQKMEAIGQLAGGVAHDFNNILAATLMHLGLLQNDPNIGPDVRSALKEVELETQRAAGLTRQLLLFSRRSVAQIKPLELNELLENLMKMLRRLIGEDITIEYSGGGRALWMEGDAGMIEQVIVNLAVNARDAMPDGGRLSILTSRVEVGSEQAAQMSDARTGTCLLLSVVDTGCGMDEATLGHIFEPFFTTKESGKGTGLGLATVYGIVRQHNGWIDVRSVVNRGTAFNIYLPARATDSEREEASDESEKVPGGNETILLVEDEAILRRAQTAYLQNLGYSVVECANGKEALSNWDRMEGRIHLLYTDMVMPEGMTGIELARRLREKSPSLPVIITSGYSADLVAKGGAATENMTYVPKPCPPLVLCKTLRECLNKKG